MKDEIKEKIKDIIINEPNEYINISDIDLNRMADVLFDFGIKTISEYIGMESVHCKDCKYRVDFSICDLLNKELANGKE